MRERDLLDRLTDLGHGAQDVADMIDAWGVGDTPAGIAVGTQMQATHTMIDAAKRVVQSELAALPQHLRDAAPRRGRYQVTWGGRKFWPLDPRPEEVHVEDVAYALASKARFCGATRAWRAGRSLYSVAEHTLNVVQLAAGLAERADLPGDQRLGFARHEFVLEVKAWAALHDANEAYLPDVQRPLKPFLRGWAQIEARVQETVEEAFGLGPITPEVEALVQHADDLALVLEAHSHLLAIDPDDAEWQDGFPRLEVPVWAGLQEWQDPRAELQALLEEIMRRGDRPKPEPQLLLDSTQRWKVERKTITEDAPSNCPICLREGKQVPAGPTGLCEGCA